MDATAAKSRGYTDADADGSVEVPPHDVEAAADAVSLKFLKPRQAHALAQLQATMIRKLRWAAAAAERYARALDEIARRRGAEQAERQARRITISDDERGRLYGRAHALRRVARELEELYSPPAEERERGGS